MNSQPFTYQERLKPGLAKRKRDKPFFDELIAAAEEVQKMSCNEASEFLATIFHLRRGAAPKVQATSVGLVDRKTLQTFLSDLAKFATNYSDSGKVGQVLAASLYDVAYPGSVVRMGNNNDPSFSLPGDVQVGDGEEFWLLSEVRQKSVTTTEVETFAKKAKENGSSRVVYFALANETYPGNIDLQKVMKWAAREDVDLEVYDAPLKAVEALIAFAPGSPSHVLQGLTSSIASRLAEARVAEEVSRAWAETVDPYLVPAEADAEASGDELLES